MSSTKISIHFFKSSTISKMETVVNRGFMGEVQELICDFDKKCGYFHFGNNHSTRGN